MYSGVLRIYKKIKDVSERDNDRQLLWELASSNVAEDWIDGQVKIMAEDSDTYEYRVGNFVLFVSANFCESFYSSRLNLKLTKEGLIMDS